MSSQIKLRKHIWSVRYPCLGPAVPCHVKEFACPEGGERPPSGPPALDSKRPYRTGLPGRGSAQFFRPISTLVGLACTSQFANKGVDRAFAASLDSQRHRSLHEHQPWVKVWTILGWRSCILQLGRSTPIRLGRSLPGPGPQGPGPGPKPRDPRPEPGRPVRKVSVAGAPILQSKSNDALLKNSWQSMQALKFIDTFKSSSPHASNRASAFFSACNCNEPACSLGWKFASRARGPVPGPGTQTHTPCAFCS